MWNAAQSIVGALASAMVLVIGCKSPEQQPKQEHDDDPLLRIASIETKLARVRGLKFESSVQGSRQTASDFRKHVRRMVEKEGSRVDDRTVALVALGLLPKSVDLGLAVENEYATQAAAYYSPEDKRYYLVTVPERNDVLETISAHELTHALQDQHFGVAQYLRGADDSDAQVARKFVVEGDATLAQVAYEVYDATQLTELTSKQLEVMRTTIEQMTALDPAAMVAKLRQQLSATSHMDPELKKSLDALDTIPLTVLVPFLDSYWQGALLALDAYERGGWRAVDALYRDPPESTEQVLHPKERLLGVRDHPRRVTLPQLGQYELVATDVIGELQWSIYFSLWKHAGGGHEEQNWGGDRFAVVRDRAGKVIALVATIWDTEYDAKVFYDAYVATLNTRYGAAPTVADDRAFVKHGDDTASVLRRGDRVFIVDGGRDDALISALVDRTSFH
jgi:hypothetical protein